MVVNSPSKVVEFPIEEAFLKVYRLRRARAGANTVEVSVPRDFVRKMARNQGLPYWEFVKQCRAVVYYGLGNELLYRFERVTDQPPKE